MASSDTRDDACDYVDPLDDVFGSAPASPTHNVASSDPEQRPQASHPSDIPRLRSMHVTNGYREGVATSKETHVQEGFDEWYALGAEVGSLAGLCLGVLEGLWTALPRTTSNELVAAASKVGQEPMTKDRLNDLRSEAAKELSMQTLLGSDYFGEDGIWLYDVPGIYDESGVTFRAVAKAHPLIQKWLQAITGVSGAMGLDLWNGELAV